ncbi:hypothetical protein Hanom_Chr00s000001g01594331 [Helianthus anomalus]
MQDHINEIKKELSEVTQIVLKNATDIRKCKDEPELYKSIHEEIKAHSVVI